MLLELVYTGKARADLTAILFFIAKDSPSGARRWVEAIEARCRVLQQFPEMGIERPEISPGLRIFPHRRAVIAYRILPGKIRIVRVFYGGQDYAALME